MTGQSGPDTPPRRVHVIRDGLAAHLPDIDPEETAEWLDSFDAVLDAAGQHRARYLMLRLLQRARERNVGVPALTSTDYVNTIPPDREPWFPGDEEVERSYRRWIRWNAAMTVHRRSGRGSGSAGTSRPTRRRPPSTRSGSTTSSAARTTTAAATRSSSRATPPPASTPAPTWRDGSPRTSWTASARSSRTAVGCRPPVLPAPAAHAGLLGVPHGLDGPRPDERDQPGAVQPLPRTTAASRTRPTSTSGRSSATARWTSRSRAG